MLAFLAVALLAVSAYGQEADFIDSQIIGGSAARMGEFPHQASLQTGTFHYCGASLITTTFVLTAAHCVNTKFRTTVVLGEHDRSRASGYEQRIESSSIRAHRGFRSGSGFPNDIALIKLSRPATLNMYVRTISLPSSANQNFVGQTCSISGWGRVTGGGTPRVLQKVSVRPLSNYRCANTWGRNILDSHICVGNGVQGSCNGDSGGPLTCGGTLAGATSWGIRGCERPGYPSVYTRVSKFLGWIRQNMY